MIEHIGKVNFAKYATFQVENHYTSHNLIFGNSVEFLSLNFPLTCHKIQRWLSKCGREIYLRGLLGVTVLFWNDDTHFREPAIMSRS